jgi:iron complex outermembrane receptor protein
MLTGRLRFRPVCATCGVIALASSLARAEDTPSEGELIEEVVVQGTRAPRSASETTLDRPLMEVAPHRTASDLLLLVPGLTITQHSGEGKAHQIFFRGFDAVHGQDLEIWAGGAPVNDVSNLHGQGYADLHFLMPEVVERVRALPGNYDPMQGDFAVAGSAYLTLGYDEPGITTKAALGSFGTERFFLAYHPPSASSATFGAAELYATDGFGTNRSARRASAMAQIEQPLGRGLSGRLFASAYTGDFDSAGVLRLEDVEQRRIERFGTYDDEQGGTSARHSLVFELSRQDEREFWSLRPYLVLRDLRLRSNFTGYLTSPEGDSIEQLNRASTFGLVASYEKPLRLFGTNASLEAGVSARADFIEQSQHRRSLLSGAITDDGSVRGVEAEVEATEVGVYLDAELHPIRRVTLRGGVRGDGVAFKTVEHGEAGARARATEDAIFSPRFSLDVYPFAELVLTASYGAGFRSPQARSLADGQAAPFARVHSAELGARYTDGEHLSAGLAGFVTDLSRDLVFDHATGRNEDVPGTRRLGLTATLSARWFERFLSSTSFTFTRAAFRDSSERYVEGDLLPYAPQIVARSDLGYERVLTHVGERALQARVGYGLSYLGRRPLPYSEFGHDVFLVDGRASLRLSEVELELEVFNLFDAAHYDSEFVYASRFDPGAAASLVPVRHVTIGAPRSFLLTLSFYV